MEILERTQHFFCIIIFNREDRNSGARLFCVLANSVNIQSFCFKKKEKKKKEEGRKRARNASKHASQAVTWPKKLRLT